MPACVGGEESGAFSRDELGPHRSDASRAPSHGDSLLLLATCLSLLPHGVIVRSGEEQRSEKCLKVAWRPKSDRSE